MVFDTLILIPYKNRQIKVIQVLGREYLHLRSLQNSRAPCFWHLGLSSAEEPETPKLHIVDTKRYGEKYTGQMKELQCNLTQLVFKQVKHKNNA